MNAAGPAATSYGFTGEWTDGTGLQHLRDRYYIPAFGRFLTRDNEPGDVFFPMSLNQWLYANGNPVVYSDPSGRVPITIPSGYAEGRVLSALALGTFAFIEGEEIVYDFFTMESARFRFRDVQSPTSPDVCFSLGGYTYSHYFSYIWGFDEEGLIDDWSGQVTTFQFGAELEVVGGGISGFVSVDNGIYDFDVFGVDIYADVGLALSSPIWVSGFTIDTVPSGYHHDYLNDDDPVESMKSDILRGTNSPINWFTDRRAAAGWVEVWYRERFR